MDINTLPLGPQGYFISKLSRSAAWQSRVVERMEAVGFSPTDPLYLAMVESAKAAQKVMDIANEQRAVNAKRS